MNGLGLGLGLGISRKQAGIGGAAAIVVGVGLILLPGGGSSGSSQHVSAADVAARIASSPVADDGSASSSSSASPTATSASSSPAPASSPASHPAPPAATTTVTQAGPNSSQAQPPQPSQPAPDPPSSSSHASTKPPAPSSHAPAPTSAKPAPPTSAPPPAGCASGSGTGGSAFAPIAGVAHTSCWGVTPEPTADDPSRGGNQDLANLADGAWAEYPHIDFGTGATQFLGRVASGAPAGISGRVEVHMDSLTNAPAAIFDIANTGGWQTWRTVPMNMNRTTGVHDVYVTFDSGQPQPFVSMHWFDFGN